MQNITFETPKAVINLPAGKELRLQFSRPALDADARPLLVEAVIDNGENDIECVLTGEYSEDNDTYTIGSEFPITVAAREAAVTLLPITDGTDRYVFGKIYSTNDVPVRIILNAGLIEVLKQDIQDIYEAP